MRCFLLIPMFFLFACQQGSPRVDPNKGSVEGGDTVSIVGGTFGAGSQVGFGKKSAGTVTVAAPNQLQVVVPSGEAPGFVDVVVTDSHGKKTTIPRGFEYLPRQEGPSGTGGGK